MGEVILYHTVSCFREGNATNMDDRESALSFNLFRSFKLFFKQRNSEFPDVICVN